MGCGRKLKYFNAELPDIDGPEYETIAAFGNLCNNYDLTSIVHANHLCNVYGIDTISTGVTIAYAMYLYNKGVLTKDRAGMEINWGDGEVIVKLVDMIGRREGIGNLLAEGSLRVANELGADLEECAVVKGLEIPMHDPRSTTGLALSYATGPRGACHLRGDYYAVDFGTRVPDYGIEPTNRFESKGKAEMTAKLQNFKDLFDSLLMCKFSGLSPTSIADLLNAITGWGYNIDDMLTIGERSIDIKRAVSNKLGITRKDDKMPKISIAPLKKGSTAGSSPDMDVLLEEYYKCRQWDWDSGKPKKEKLQELGLDDVAKDLWS
jgi:aldehyde:ferredoxin oxidoreductase